MVFKRKAKTQNSVQRAPGLVVSGRPQSIIAEQFRTVRTNIQFSMVDRDLKSLIITSAGPGCGKSVTAANLATTFGSADYRVLLVDADLRKPTVHETFRLKNSTGLTTLLMNRRSELTDMIYKTATEGLYLLTSGPVPPNPADLLGSNRMDALIEEMEETFDLVIFDMPPLLPVADAQVMASKAGGVIFVLPLKEVTKEDVLQSKEILEMAEANVLGVIHNKAENAGNGYYYYAEEE